MLNQLRLLVLSTAVLAGAGTLRVVLLRRGLGSPSLDWPDHEQPRARDQKAPVPMPGRRGTGSESADQDPLPARVTDLPVDVHHRAVIVGLTANTRLRRMSIGRWVVPGVFVLLAALTAAAALHSCLRALANPDLRDVVTAGYSLICTAIVVAFVRFVVTRDPARSPSRDPVAFAACAAAIGAVACLQGPADSVPAALALTGVLVALASCVWVLAAVLALGTCFAVLPEARGLVTRGPYRLVRHPVYLGELGAYAGLVIGSPTGRNLSAAIVFAAAQAVRMRLEERALIKEFPDYARYAARTPRLVPVMPLRSVAWWRRAGFCDLARDSLAHTHKAPAARSG